MKNYVAGNHRMVYLANGKPLDIMGSNYYMTFIDNSSRKVWVYFLKKKFDVFDTFKRWRVMVENESDLKVKCLHSDNRGEYIDANFQRYYDENEMKMRKIILAMYKDVLTENPKSANLKVKKSEVILLQDLPVVEVEKTDGGG
ncbi:Integrase catalytic domain-containing protein [Abeliophyllum distichum]|uniref:Integrase catalytic domain-containing protein n=1 Tax=Abeliophyllum distichum TaxID=126358 RepID=A0ABD1RDS9_9LAMI